MKVYYLIRIYFIIIIFSTLSFNTNFNSRKECQNEYFGSWIYDYSIIDGNKVLLNNLKKKIPYKYIFEKCNDKIELINTAVSVKKMRKGNFFNNVSCSTFDNNGILIDKSFPVLTPYNGLKFVTNYGKKTKVEYYIIWVNKTSIIIYDETYIEYGGKEYSAVKHFYKKEMQ